MGKFFMLAVPVLSLALLAGCCADGTCYSSASIAEPAVVATRVEAADTEVAAPATAVAARETVPAAPRAVSSSSMITRIPAMALPEGWSYIDESDLLDGPLVSGKSVGELSQTPVARNDS